MATGYASPRALSTRASFPTSAPRPSEQSETSGTDDPRPRNSNFTQVDNEIFFDYDLSKHGKTAWTSLKVLSVGASRFVASYPELAGVFTVSESSIKRGIRELRERGLVEVINRGSGRPSAFVLQPVTKRPRRDARGWAKPGLTDPAHTEPGLTDQGEERNPGLTDQGSGAKPGLTDPHDLRFKDQERERSSSASVAAFPGRQDDDDDLSRSDGISDRRVEQVLELWTKHTGRERHRRPSERDRKAAESLVDVPLDVVDAGIMLSVERCPSPSGPSSLGYCVNAIRELEAKARSPRVAENPPADRRNAASTASAAPAEPSVVAHRRRELEAIAAQSPGLSAAERVDELERRLAERGSASGLSRAELLTLAGASTAPESPVAPAVDASRPSVPEADVTIALVDAIARGCVGVASAADLMPADASACQTAALACASRGFTAADVWALVRGWKRETLPYPSQVVREIQRTKGAKDARRLATRATTPAPKTAAPHPMPPIVGVRPPWIEKGERSPLTGRVFGVK